MNRSRRRFLSDVSRAVALPATWNAFAAALQGATGSDASESFWRMVRAQFPLEDNLIYLNAANVALRRGR